MDMFEFIVSGILGGVIGAVIFIVLETILVKWLTYRDLKKFNEKYNKK